MLRMGKENADFIRNNYPHRYSVKELAIILNVNIDYIRYFVRTRGLSQGLNNRSSYWSKDKLQFLYDNRNLKSRLLLEKFNEEFAIPTSFRNLQHGRRLMFQELYKDNSEIKRNSK